MLVKDLQMSLVGQSEQVADLITQSISLIVSLAVACAFAHRVVCLGGCIVEMGLDVLL